MKERRKILIISSEFPPNVGGIGNHAYNLANSFSREGFDVIVVADINAVMKDELSVFRAELSFKLKPVIRRKAVWLTYINRIRSAVAAAHTADYIICSGKFSLWLINVLRLVYKRKKIVAVVHGSELDLKEQKANQLVTSALKKVNAIISVSSYTKQYIDKEVIERVPCYIIHNGINIYEYKTELLNRTDEPLHLITIGSMTDRKGQENVIKALPVILKSFPKAIYRIVGKPLQKEKLQQLIESLSLTQFVIFHDELPRYEMLKLLNNCAIKLMLSNHTSEGDFEGFGIAILEANALGKPAIGSNFGGITDAIQDGKTGRLVNPYNADEITWAVKNILDNYGNYSSNALAWAKQHDWKIIIKEYVSVLNGLK